MRRRRSSFFIWASRRYCAPALPERLHVGRLEAEGEVRGVADDQEARQPLGRRQPRDGSVRDALGHAVQSPSPSRCGSARPRSWGRRECRVRVAVVDRAKLDDAATVAAAVIQTPPSGAAGPAARTAGLDDRAGRHSRWQGPRGDEAVAAGGHRLDEAVATRRCRAGPTAASRRRN